MKSIVEVSLLAAWVGYNRLRSFGNGQQEEEEEEDGIAFSTSKVGWFHSADEQYDPSMGNFKSSAQFGLIKIWDLSFVSTCLLLSQVDQIKLKCDKYIQISKYLLRHSFVLIFNTNIFRNSFMSKFWIQVYSDICSYQHFDTNVFWYSFVPFSWYKYIQILVCIKIQGGFFNCPHP